MNYSELISEFLDGSLDVAKEDTLFSGLSANEDLRSELKELLAIRRAVGSDKVAFTPSAASTHAIFSQLGFTAPVAPIATAGSQGALSSLSTSVASFFGKYSQAVVAAALSTVVTSAVFLTTMNNDTPASLAADTSETLQRDLSFERINSSPYPYGDNQTMLASAVLPEQVAPREVVKFVYPDPLPAEPTSTDDATPAIREDEAPVYQQERHAGLQYTTLLAEVSNSLNAPSANQSGLRPLEAAPDAFAGLNLDRLITTESPVKVSVELRGNSDFHYSQNADVSSGGDPWFNHMAVNVLWNVGENISFGPAFGQEVFGQVFDAVNAEGKSVEVQQKPRMFWGGLVGRMYLIDNKSLFAPFGQLTTGFNRFGFVLKPMLGASFTPDSHISLVGGVEYSHLFYRQDKSNFASGKFAFSYGVSYRF